MLWLLIPLSLILAGLVALYLVMESVSRRLLALFADPGGLAPGLEEDADPWEESPSWTAASGAVPKIVSAVVDWVERRPLLRWLFWRSLYPLMVGFYYAGAALDFPIYRQQGQRSRRRLGRQLLREISRLHLEQG